MDDLLNPYVGPQVAERLTSGQHPAGLGSEERDVTVLFADLAGFTSFSECRPSGEVIAMLNQYWDVAAPIVTEREGRVIERFAGDAMMVVFNALTEQPDHALRAARAALGVRTEVEAIAAGHPGRPPFRLGINTGPAIAGDVRGGPQRSFAAIGDTTNLAARLQAAASPGQIVLGPETCRRIVGLAHIAPLEPLVLKGKREPVEAGELLGLTP